MMWKFGYIGMKIATGLTAVHKSLQMWSGWARSTFTLIHSLAHIKEKIKGGPPIDAGRNTGIGLPLLMLHRQEHDLAQVCTNQHRCSKYRECSCHTALDQLSKRCNEG